MFLISFKDKKEELYTVANTKTTKNLFRFLNKCLKLFFRTIDFHENEAELINHFL